MPMRSAAIEPSTIGTARPTTQDDRMDLCQPQLIDDFWHAVKRALDEKGIPNDL